MSLCKTYLGRERKDLTYDFIVEYFSKPREESDHIELKSYHEPLTAKEKKALYDPVCETISAFLNSDGGILIWGAPTGKVGEGDKKEKIFQGDLAPITEVIEKDALISRISDLIKPLTNDIKVEILENEGNFVCVFEIDRSKHTAYQYKNIYYMRLDGQNRIAPPYVIEALMKQIKYPNIEGYIKINSFQTGFDNPAIPRNNIGQLDVSIVIFNWSKVQNELDLNISLFCNNAIFSEWERREVLPDGYNFYTEGHTFSIEKARTVLSFGQPFVHSTILKLVRHIKSRTFDNIDLILTFGGRYSPLKISEYKIDVNQYTHDNVNQAIIEMTQNEFMSDGSEKKGATRESILKDILCR